MLIKRRTFFQTGSLATASLLIPGFVKAFERKGLAPPGNKVLVVLQLSGGNDGLNTVIPIRNDDYYKARPGLSISKNQALILNDESGIHPGLKTFKDLYDDGSLGILHGVGYPNPDRSHFRSMDIWQTGSSAGEYFKTGWIGRWLDAQCTGCDKPTQALEIDDTLSLALKGEKWKGISFKDPSRLYSMSREKYFRELVSAHQTGQSGKPTEYLYKVMAETISGAEYIYEQSRMHPAGMNYPKTELGKSLQTIASLILSDINTQLYYVSIGSFDTHINQQATQQRLFTEINDAILAFVSDLKANHRFNDVLMMTFSEFGRRVSQNASGGTDHGTANNMFMISGSLKQKGMLNPMPDLSDLTEGDLKFQLDFRNVYATVLNKWLNANDQVILSRQAEYLQFI
jgi:uncharacterized protein (DUF1501 family)